MRPEQSGPVEASIIVVTFNSRTDIDACLRSVEAYSPDAEIIVVDNMSSDGTIDYVQEHFPGVRAIAAGRNGGFGAGVNLGVQMAAGKFIAVLNPDTEVEAGWLRPLIDVLESRPDVGLVTPTILLKGTAERVNACGNDVHLTGLAFCAKFNHPAPPRSDLPRPVPAISGAAFAVRRSLWEQLDGFDERFFMYLEDTDISWRVLRAGFTIMHVPASRVRHGYELAMSASKLYHLEYNHPLMLRRNLSWATLAVLAPALLVKEMLIWAYCTTKGRAYLRAKWRSYHHLWRDRRKISRYVLPHRHPDHSLLRTLNARLAVEQLANSSGVLLANHLLTIFFALWHRIALAVVRW